MKLKDEISGFKKEWVHRCYSRIIRNFDDYEKISRNKMLDAVFDFYDDYNNILDICSSKEILLLKKFIGRKKINDINKIDDFEYRELRNKFLLFDSLPGGICIPDEIIDKVKLAIKNFDKKNFIEKDSLNELLIGLLKIYGAVKPDEFYEIVSKYVDIDIDDFNRHIQKSKYFQFYSYLVNYKGNMYVVYEPYYFFSDELIDNIIQTTKKMAISIRPIEEVIYLRYHQFNDKNENVAIFLKEVNKLMFFQSSLFELMEEYVALDRQREELIDAFKSIPALRYENLSNVIELMNAAMNDMPSATLRGATRYEYAGEQKKIKYDQKYNTAYNSIKNNAKILKYKEIREKVNIIYEECLMFTYNNNLLGKFDECISKNNLIFRKTDTNIATNFLIFHSVSDEPTIFEEYYAKQMNILNVNYALFNQFKKSYVEGLFIIKKMDSTNAQVTLEDTSTKEKYIVTDVAFSCGSKELINSYIYTSLVTINGFTFTTDYSFIITKKKNKNIFDEINKKEDKIKCVYNDNTRKFIACYSLFKEEDIMFTTKVLD